MNIHLVQNSLFPSPKNCTIWGAGVISFSDCAVNITQPVGVITSPGFPQPYQNGINCTWNIQLPIGQLIQLNFLHFKIENVNFNDVEECQWVILLQANG